MNAWNLLHGDDFLTQETDVVFSCLVEMVKLWRKSKNNQ